jgi:phage shock protein PspC (stress-responsive transcriptional regulator)
MGTAEEITRLREGGMLDYDMDTWEVTTYESYTDPNWPDDEWTLKRGTNTRFLEHEAGDDDLFRMYAPADITRVTVDGRPFLSAVGQQAPGTITYEGDQYILSEEDARIDTTSVLTHDELVRVDRHSKLMGVCGGIAAYTGISPTIIRLGFIGALLGVSVVSFVYSPVVALSYGVLGVIMPKESESDAEGELSHYWVYEKDDQFVMLECMGSNDWDAYAGRAVDPYEFNNVLPTGTSD